ncbi:MAG: hypothetical protein AAGJ97_04950 [Planctomycetota bacterium]
MTDRHCGYWPETDAATESRVGVTHTRVETSRGRGTVSCLHGDDGRTLWTVELPDGLVPYGVRIHRDRVFVASPRRDRYYESRPADPDVIASGFGWRYDTDDDGDFVDLAGNPERFVPEFDEADWNTTLFALRLSDGGVLWRYDAPTDRLGFHEIAGQIFRWGPRYMLGCGGKPHLKPHVMPDDPGQVLVPTRVDRDATFASIVDIETGEEVGRITPHSYVAPTPLSIDYTYLAGGTQRAETWDVTPARLASAKVERLLDPDNPLGQEFLYARDVEVAGDGTIYAMLAGPGRRGLDQGYEQGDAVVIACDRTGRIDGYIEPYGGDVHHAYGDAPLRRLRPAGTPTTLRSNTAGRMFHLGGLRKTSRGVALFNGTPTGSSAGFGQPASFFGSFTEFRTRPSRVGMHVLTHQGLLERVNTADDDGDPEITVGPGAEYGFPLSGGFYRASSGSGPDYDGGYQGTAFDGVPGLNPAGDVIFGKLNGQRGDRGDSSNYTLFCGPLAGGTVPYNDGGDMNAGAAHSLVRDNRDRGRPGPRDDSAWAAWSAWPAYSGLSPSATNSPRRDPEFEAEGVSGRTRIFGPGGMTDWSEELGDWFSWTSFSTRFYRGTVSFCATRGGVPSFGAVIRHGRSLHAPRWVSTLDQLTVDRAGEPLVANSRDLSTANPNNTNVTSGGEQPRTSEPVAFPTQVTKGPRDWFQVHDLAYAAEAA